VTGGFATSLAAFCASVTAFFALFIRSFMDCAELGPVARARLSNIISILFMLTPLAVAPASYFRWCKWLAIPQLLSESGRDVSN
jgi:hypothetical protein